MERGILKKLIDGGERGWGVVGVFAVVILAGMWIETFLYLEEHIVPQCCHSGWDVD